MHHTVGTAAMFLQRFYMRMSLRDYPPKVRLACAHRKEARADVV
jgi:hypothetical protein